ncbi:MAG TPA: hypothetical protein DCS93_24895 [Microscillaceae bacterium]|nr:hypothetical protein [Microscillaceae bacterium]
MKSKVYSQLNSYTVLFVSLQKLITLCCLVILGTLQAKAQWTQVSKILASDGQSSDEFGRSVSISGNYAIVGAFKEDTGGYGAGAAYIYNYNGTNWVQEAKILASDAEEDDTFGYSVSISGDYAIVGAYEEETGGNKAGAAYIFKRNGTTWTQEAKIQASDKQAYDYFGFSVAIDGDCVVVGAIQEDTGGSDVGAAYIFKRNGTTWTQEAKIQASDKQKNDNFGESVSISGDYVIVGADKEDTGGNKAGAAYIFKRDGIAWTQETKIQANDKEAFDSFGNSVSLSGDYAIVGASGEGTTGAAYIFKRDGTTWTQEAKIQSNDIEAFDRFGSAVSISGDYAIVGATLEDTGGSNAGAGYIFKRDGITWTQEAKIQANDRQGNDNFGSSVAISGDYVIIGADGEDAKGSGAGASYIFSLLPAEINVQGNENDIADEETNISNANNTSFGVVGNSGKVLSYTIQNTGAKDLTIAGIYSDNSDFTIGGLSFPVTIAGGSEASFTIIFNPTGANGTKTVNISIENNDSDENPYNFVVQGYKVNEAPDGVKGNMMAFGGGASVDLPVSLLSTTNANQPYTIELWAKTTSTNAGGIFTQYQYPGSGERFGLRLRSGRFACWQGGIGYLATSSTVVNDGEWHHLVFTKNASGNIQLYIDGMPDGTGTHTDVFQNVNTVIGRFPSSPATFTGSMDEVRVWDDVRTIEEIRGNMHLTLSGAEDNLIAYYQFNEETGEAIDKISGNNGTLVNNPVRTTSEVAVAGGVSEGQVVSVAGDVLFSNPALKLKFAAVSLPDNSGDNKDEFWVYQLKEILEHNITGINTHTSSYWIIHHFDAPTTTQTFSISEATFTILSNEEISTDDMATPSNLKLYKRNSNSSDDAWGGSPYASATSVDNTSKEIVFSGLAMSSLSEFIIASTNNSSLPIELLSFEAKRKNEREVLLTWITATETNNAGFEIEMSKDARHFQKAAFVAGAGNSVEVKNYRWIMNHTKGAYYRLKQLDFDGSFAYSSLRFVKATTEEPNLTVYPNPTQGVIHLNIVDYEADINLKVLDLQGKEIIVLNGTQEVINQKLHQVFPRWQHGVYVFQVEAKDKTWTRKIVISR